MMTTILAFAIFCATTLLVLGNLRGVAQDTYQALSHSAKRLKENGHLGAKLAFVALWVLIFALGYF